MFNLSASTLNKMFFIQLLVAGLLALMFFQLPDNKFHLYFFDVGQGDAVFIKTPENYQILIDGGPKNFVLEKLAKVMPFMDKSLDLVILTHPHSDHIEGLVEVLKRYKIDSVLLTGVNDGSVAYEEFLKEIIDKNIRVIIAEKSGDFYAGSVFFNILYPFSSIANYDFKNLNDSSIALKIIYKNLSVLLTGDLQKEMEILIKNSGEDINSDIFKAGHHGSKTSNDSEFLKEVSPKFAVISVGRGNKFGHPNIETIDTFNKFAEKILRTDLNGTIEFSL
jgi:competence protein ComEC